MKCDYCGKRTWSWKLPAIYSKEVRYRKGWRARLRLWKFFEFDSRACLEAFEKERPDLAV